MSRHPLRLLLALALVMGGVRWVWNSNDWSGPVLMSISKGHGVHLNDWLTLALWTAALRVACPVWLQALTRRARRLCRRSALVASGLTLRTARADH